MKCEICKAGDISGGTYDDGVCSNCGQKYEYEEGARIVLTADQIAWLNLIRDTPAKSGVVILYP